MDPVNIDPTIQPSGPVCDAEVPRRIHVEVPVPEADVRFVYQQLSGIRRCRTGRSFSPPRQACASSR